MTQFLLGLKNELRAAVEVQVPNSISEAASFARPHSLRIRRILFEFPFLHLESGLFYLRLIFLALFFIYFISIFPSSSIPIL